MANTYLSKTFSSEGNRAKWTWSGWVKKTVTGSRMHLFTSYYNASNFCTLNWESDDELNFYDYNGGAINGQRHLSMKMRDTNAWYHIVATFDSGNSTTEDKMKVWINGTRQTAFESNSAPSGDSRMNHTIPLYIGAYDTSSYFFNGLISHVHFTDGYVYDASAFGSTDSTTGEWKINTSPSVTYGTNGFWILKDGNSVTDSSPNSNNFTVAGGTLTKTEDNPSNVFATLSPDILPRNSGESITNGSLTFGTSAAIWNTESSAFGITNGKYYFEVKLKDNGSDRRFRWGLQKNAEITKTGENKVLGGTDNNAIGYATQGETASQGSYIINQTSTTMSDGDINENNAIYGFAIDLDNQRMYGHFNGTWFHSGNPSAGSGGLDVSSFYTVGEPLFPSFTVHNSIIEINFGNGYFGTTAVATNSGNGYQDADGNGIFNYTVPTNFRCLSTKGLNQ